MCINNGCWLATGQAQELYLIIIFVTIRFYTRDGVHLNTRDHPFQRNIFDYLQNLLHACQVAMTISKFAKENVFPL